MTDGQAAALLDEFARYIEEYVVPRAVRTVVSAIERQRTRGHWWEAVGAYLREAAVLVLIIIPVDWLLPQSARTGQPVSGKLLVDTLIVSVGMLIVGTWLGGKK